MDYEFSAGDIVIIVFFSIIGILTVVLWIALIVSCYIKRKNIYNQGVYQKAPVVVTSATHTAPGGYPVTQMPVGATTTTYQAHTYAAPYPPQGAPIHMPMPMPTSQPPAMGMYPNMAPYPQMPAATMNPPSYDVAVSGAGVGQPNDTAYQKQAPYNPNFQM